MFYSPWYLLLLVALPLLGWRLLRRRRRSSITFSSLDAAVQLTPTLRQRLLWVPPALTIATCLLLILALARPREGQERTVVDSEGIAIELVVDRSSSMQAMDFNIDGQPVDRLTAIKQVVGKFVTGDDQLEGRFNDLIGLISYAGYADGITPPTLDHSFLISSLNQTELAQTEVEDGTAIGDAIALAVEKLNAIDQGQQETINSKVIILLTDGENTAGELDPVTAAELAQTMGIKIYCIGVGTKGRAPIVTRNFGRELIQYVNVNIDETALRQVAEITAGKYFRATDTDSLAAIYQEIDELEKNKVESDSFVSYRELAVQPYRRGPIVIPPLISIALGLLSLRAALQFTWLRELV